MRKKTTESNATRKEDSATPQKDFFSMTAEERGAIFTDAVKEQIAMHHAAGRATPHADDQGVFFLSPDGHREYINQESKS